MKKIKKYRKWIIAGLINLVMLGLLVLGGLQSV